MKDSNKSLEEKSKELFEITEGRLKAEEDAVAANKTITQKLKNASVKLDDMDTKVRSLQLNRSAAFNTSLDDTKTITTKVRNIESLKIVLKDLQVSIYEIQRALNKKSLIIGRGKANSAINKVLQNEYLKESKYLQDDIKLIGERISNLVERQMELLGKPASDRNKFDETLKWVTEKLSAVLLNTEQEIAAANEKFELETKKQGNMVVEANTANNALVRNSKFIALSLYIEGLTTRLFTAISNVKEIDAIESEVKKTFEKVDNTVKPIETALKRLDAKEEVKTLDGVKGALNSIKGLLLATATAYERKGIAGYRKTEGNRCKAGRTGQKNRCNR